MDVVKMVDYSALSDSELLILLLDSDHAAYEEIYNRYWILLYRHARKALQNAEAARDVVQDVFVMLWAKREELKINTSVPAFLYTVVRNKVLDIYKRNKVADNHLDSLKQFIDHGTNVTDHRVRERELTVIIEHEISLLPDRMREVFELKRKSNLSYKEIALQMGISELTVKTQMTKAIKVLRAKLGANMFSISFPFL